MKRNIVFIVVLSLVSVFLADYFCKILGYGFEPVGELEPEPVEAPILEYGIPIDSFNVSDGRIKYGQTLGALFLSLNVRSDVINQLVKVNIDGFGARSIKAGNIYKVFTTKDSLSLPVYFVYQESPVNFYVFNLVDSLVAYRFEKEIEAVRKVSEAEISSSLWETMRSQGINPVLALDLSDVFAWTVDFFGLFPGDRFRVMYDELYVDTTSVGIGTIYAAWFEHRGETFYAFGFDQDSSFSYWDENGNSLKKSFLKAPLRFSRISSRYSGSRFHPILKIYRPHTGVDYAAPAGTPVVAIGDGVIIGKGYNKAAGNFVKIRHNSVYTTGYNHFSRFGKGIAMGKRVKQGDIIGYVGSTGYATGPHLDFRFWKNDRPMDPLKVKSPAVEPVKKENMSQFLFTRDSLLMLLDSTKMSTVNLCKSDSSILTAKKTPSNL